SIWRKSMMYWQCKWRMVLARRPAPRPARSKAKASKGTSDTPDELELLEKATTPTTASGGLLKTKGLSMEEDQPKVAKGRKVAILVAAGVAIDEVEQCRIRSRHRT